MTDFLSWLAEREGRPFPTHDDLWAWSVRETEKYWAAVWDYVGISSSTPYSAVLTGTEMPDVRWFTDAHLNYAQHCLRPGNDADIALICVGETPAGEEPAQRHITRGELRRQVGALADWLRRAGVRPGDRVGAYLPNTEQAVIALLATAAVGAVWAVCSPDFGPEGSVARLAQLDPTVLFVVDGYHWNGRTVDRRNVAAALSLEIPSVRAVVHVSYAFDEPGPGGAGHHRWSEVVQGDAELAFEQVEFSHPLWVLFSSGTTGAPKGLVHGHGGIILSHLMYSRLYIDLRPQDRFFIYTSTAWMVWNVLVSGLATGAASILYEGSPGYPDPGALWQAVASTRANAIALGAALVTAVQQAGISPKDRYDLTALKTMLVSGSALPTDGYGFVRDHIGARVRLDSTSGGTDICGAFVGGNDLLPVRVGEISGPIAGVAVAAWDDGGRPLIGQVGELVVTRPMPSMPLYLWNDADGGRYRETYFDTWPGVWRHGDWITMTESNSVVVHGRSDATLNRDGVRIGSAEFYDVVDAMPQIRDSLVVGVDIPGGRQRLPLFVVLADGQSLDDELIADIRHALRTQKSPRHVPDEVVQTPAIPRTLTGKRLEVPVKKLLAGVPLGRAVNLDAVDDPAAVRWFAEYAEHSAARPT